jgi:hypothetical protein
VTSTIKSIEIFQIILACVGLISTASVIAILTYKYNTIVSGRTFIYWIYCIAISDFFSSLGYSMGYPTNPLLNSIQGFLIVVFSRFSWFYSVVLVFNTWYVVFYMKFMMKPIYFQCIVIVLNLILFVLPFTNGCYYGAHNTCEAGYQISTIGEKDGHGARASRWIGIVFFPWLLLSFFIIFVLGISLVIKSYRKNNKKFIIANFDTAHETIFLYILGMIIAWVPNVIYNFVENVYSIHHDGAYPSNVTQVCDILIAMNTLYGSILSLIFWMKVEIARKELYSVYRSIKSYITGDVSESLMEVNIERSSEDSVNRISMKIDNNHL